MGSERGKTLETQKTTSGRRNLPGFSTRRISNSERLLHSLLALRADHGIIGNVELIYERAAQA